MIEHRIVMRQRPWGVTGPGASGQCDRRHSSARAPVYGPPRSGVASSLNDLKHILNDDFMSPRPPGPGKRSRTHADTGARPRAVEEVL